MLFIEGLLKVICGQLIFIAFYKYRNDACVDELKLMLFFLGLLVAKFVVFFCWLLFVRSNI